MIMIEKTGQIVYCVIGGMNLCTEKIQLPIGEWIKNSNKALLVTGARQIGKTWLIRDEIEKSGYTKFEVNFIDQPDMVSYLNAEMSAEDFLIKLK